MTSSPAQTRVSLLARPMRFFSRMAANVGFNPNNLDEEMDKFGLQRVNVNHNLVHFVCGMSFEFSKVVIDARYVTPFKRPQQEFYSFNNPDPSATYKLTYHQLQFSVGVLF